MAGIDYGRLIVRPPYGAAQDRAIGGPVVTFGGAGDNDVVLDDPSVSAHHARLVIEGGELSIEDLGSTQNTVVNDAPITPNVRYRLSGQERIRLGDVEVTYVAPVAASRPVAAAPYGPPLKLTVVDPPRAVEPGPFPVYSVAPGGEVVVEVSAESRLPHPVKLSVLVDGVPQGWVGEMPQVAELPEFGWLDLQVKLAPPRASGARAGLHPFVVRISSEDWEGVRHEALAPGLLSVETYGRVRLSIAAGKSADVFPLQVDNVGNDGVVVDISAEVFGKPQLACDVKPAALQLPAGETGVAELSVRDPARPIVRTPSPVSITVSAAPRDAAADSQAGTVDYAPPALIPLWLLVVAVGAVVAAVALVALLL